jgi:hypothetical protein
MTLSRYGSVALAALLLSVPVLAESLPQAVGAPKAAAVCRADQPIGPNFHLPGVDFNGDQLSDLVVGMPGADHGAGAVAVHYSYSASKVRILREGIDGIPGPHTAGNGFGTAIVADQFNVDACSDLLIGIPNLTVHGVKGAGGVQVLFGRPNGFVAGPLITRASAGVPGTPSSGEHFGTAIFTAASIPRVNDDEVYIGVPGATVAGPKGPVKAAGEVVELTYNHTTSTRLPTPSAAVFYQGHGVNGDPVANAHLGQSLGMAGYWPSAGAPNETVNGKKGAGFWGNLAPDGSFDDTQLTRVSYSGTSADEHLGASIIFDGGPCSPSGEQQWCPMVGAPGMTVAGHHGAGAVEVYYLNSEDNSFGTFTFVKTLTQNTPGIPGAAATGAGFGTSLSLGPVSNTIETGPGLQTGVAIGVPDQTVAGHRGAGAVITLHSSGKGNLYSMIDQATAHVPGIAEAGDHFGATLSYTQRWISAKTFVLRLVVGDPGENLGHAVNAGAVEIFPVTRASAVGSHPAKILTRPHPTSGDRYGAGIVSIS